ncbi:MAG: AI-2E family transporter [Pseudobutyrivibrio sp.]|nr:AI-2E family transporter [Pseudobutyrivibrio sp.]
MKNIKDKSWYTLAVAICIGVVLLVILIRLNVVLNAIGTFLGFFSSVFLGAVIAYIINPLSLFFRNRVFCKIKKDSLKALMGNFAAFIAVIIMIVFLTVMVVPQLVDSVFTFTENLDDYVAGLQESLDSIGISSTVINLDALNKSSGEIFSSVSKYVKENIDTIMTTTVDVGKAISTGLIGFVLSIYFLAEKDKLIKGGKRFLKAVFKGNYDKVAYVLRKSNKILNRYIVYNLVDAMIIGIVNAIFMTVSGLPYVGLVSVIVAVTNIIPTFGPLIGAALGGFLLLLVEPWCAGAFLAFTAILQILDGYIIKPKLFGDSLGVSGLWILIGIVAGGKMFGVVGILLAIPTVAILDMLYHEFLLPYLEGNNNQEI